MFDIANNATIITIAGDSPEKGPSQAPSSPRHKADDAKMDVANENGRPISARAAVVA